MGVPLARVGDIGICSHKPGVALINTGAPTVMAGGVPVANGSSTGTTFDGLPTIAGTMSATVYAAGLGVHRVGDIGIHPKGIYIVAVGIPTVVAG